jgi:hypothetical protein
MSCKKTKEGVQNVVHATQKSSVSNGVYRGIVANRVVEYSSLNEGNSKFSSSSGMTISGENKAFGN